VPAHVQANGAEHADAADANHFEGDVLEFVSVDKEKPVGRQAFFISVEHAPGIEAIAGVALPSEMIDEGRPIRDARLIAFDQTREIIVLGEMLARLGENTLELTPEFAVVYSIDLLRQVDHAVPGLQRRKLCQAADTNAIGLDGGCR